MLVPRFCLEWGGKQAAGQSQVPTLLMPQSCRGEGCPRGSKEGTRQGGNDTAPGEQLNDAGASGWRANVTEER